MNVLGFIMVFLGITMLMRVLNNLSEENKPCKQHVWYYRADDQMECSVCHKQPGYQGR